MQACTYLNALAGTVLFGLTSFAACGGPPTQASSPSAPDSPAAASSADMPDSGRRDLARTFFFTDARRSRICGARRGARSQHERHPRGRRQQPRLLSSLLRQVAEDSIPTSKAPSS